MKHYRRQHALAVLLGLLVGMPAAQAGQIYLYANSLDNGTVQRYDWATGGLVDTIRNEAITSWHGGTYHQPSNVSLSLRTGGAEYRHHRPLQ